jgi:hypothetical protein
VGLVTDATLPDVAVTVGRMRPLLALALGACEQTEVEPWAIECTHAGHELRVVLNNDGDVAAAEQLAAVLGVVDPLTRVQHSVSKTGGPGDFIVTVGSRLPREPWHKPDRPDYFGASVEFDGRLIEVTVTVYGVKEDPR